MGRPQSATIRAMTLDVPLESVRFVSIGSWIKAAVHCQINIEPLLRRAGIADALRSDPTPPIRVQDMAELMAHCTQQAAKGCCFPLELGELFAFDRLPALETFLTTAATPRDALAALHWVGHVFPHMSIQLEESGERAALLVESTMPNVREDIRGLFVMKDMASIARFARTLLGASVQGQQVLLRHDPGQEVLEMLSQRYGLPVNVGQPRNALVFERRLLDQPLLGAVPSLNLQARVQVARQLPQHPQAELADTLAAWFDQEPALLVAPVAEIAARMRMHPRTLQRRLKESGANLVGLRDQSRHRLAVAALSKADDTWDLEALSDMLGFSDRHSLTRAFKRWTGLTPTDWRLQARGG